MPMFIVLFPVGVACALWLPNFVAIARMAGALAGPLGLAMLLSQIGRDRGYRKQPELWQKWGGSPTVQLLRHGNEKFNPVIRERYHGRLGLLLPDLTLPSHEEEKCDPRCADDIYEACVKYLIGRTRDQEKFPMVFKENVNHGFRRNLWGLKPLGLVLSASAFVACVASAWLMKDASESQMGTAVVASSLTFVVFLFWIVVVNEMWVRIPADAYAARLLESCEDLEIIRGP